MPTALQGISWFPAKGLNDTMAPNAVPMDMASDGYDWVVNNFSELVKRDGVSAVNTTAVSATPTINSLASLYLSSGTKYELVGTVNGDVWVDSSGTITTKILSGLSTTQPFDFTQLLDTLVVADGTNQLRSWDGSSSAIITGAASGAKYAESHLNKIFIAGMSYSASRVDYGGTGTLTTWSGTGTDQFNVNQNDGQVVTGLKSFSSNELMIFKERSMWKLVGYDKPTFNVVSVDTGIGCISNRSIQTYNFSSLGSIMIFAARDGVYIYDGTKPRKISGYIQTMWNTINFSRGEHFASCIDKVNSRYLLSVPVGTATENNRVIAIDLIHPWEDENGLHFPCFLWRVSCQALNTEFSATSTQKIVIGSTLGIKKRFDSLVYSDSTTAIESYPVSPLITFQDGIGNEQCLRRAYITFQGSAGTVNFDTETKDSTDWTTQDSININQGSAEIGTTFTIGTSPIGLSENNYTTRVNTRVRGRKIKIRVYHNSASQTFGISRPVELYFKSGGHRG